ncbi:hypothetical protein GW17_00019168 [Ensete ventricosum]|nr:hypothetical protein GW17_00019168 [Ensete ventricosum]
MAKMKEVKRPPLYGKPPLVAWPRATAPYRLAVVGRACGQLLPLRVATPCELLPLLLVAPCKRAGHSRPPLCRGALAAADRARKRLLPLRAIAPCRGPGRSRPPLCKGAWAAVAPPSRWSGHAMLSLLLVAFAVKTQQERVERFDAIQSHYTQFKTNLLHENLGSDTTNGNPLSYIPVFQIRIEKMKEVKRPPL